VWGHGALYFWKGDTSILINKEKATISHALTEEGRAVYNATHISINVRI